MTVNKFCPTISLCPYILSTTITKSYPSCKMEYHQIPRFLFAGFYTGALSTSFLIVLENGF